MTPHDAEEQLRPALSAVLTADDAAAAAKYLVSNQGMRRDRADRVIDAILSLARPVESVVLTLAEAAFVARWLRGLPPPAGQTADDYIAAADALAARLEEAS